VDGRIFCIDPRCSWDLVLQYDGAAAGRTLTNCAFSTDARALFIADSETASFLACEVPAP
jgi:hypothetical protein